MGNISRYFDKRKNNSSNNNKPYSKDKGSGPPKEKELYWRIKGADEGQYNNIYKKLKEYRWCDRCNFWNNGNGIHITSEHISKEEHPKVDVERKHQGGNTATKSGVDDIEDSDKYVFVISGLRLIGSLCHFKDHPIKIQNFAETGLIYLEFTTELNILHSSMILLKIKFKRSPQTLSKVLSVSKGFTMNDKHQFFENKDSKIKVGEEMNIHIKQLLNNKINNGISVLEIFKNRISFNWNKD